MATRVFKGPHFMRYLKFQLAAYYFLTSLVAVVILGTVLYVSIGDLFLQNTLKETIASVDSNGRLIDLYLENLKTLSKTLASDSDTLLYLKEGDRAAGARTQARIDEILASNAHIVAAELVPYSETVKDESWYALAMANMGMPVLTSIRNTNFTMDKSTWVISVGQEVVGPNKEHLGVVLLDFSYKTIEDLLLNLDLGSQGQAFIMTHSNELVYHKDPRYFDSPSLQGELVAICDMGTGYDKGMNKLTHHYELKSANWVLVGLSSLDDMTIARRQILESLIAIGLILLFIVLGSGLLIANSVTRPIHALQGAMKAFSDQLTISDLAAPGSVEIEALRGQFMSMAQHIQRLMEDVKTQERYLRESEIKILYSQINPHFLYNTLDTIIWLAEFGDSEGVISTTRALSQFFRISLSKGEDLIPLKQELEHVSHYLFIQSKRYGDKLSYEITCSPDLERALASREILVPKILLQPLVENAIYHGIRPQAGGGRVWVAARLSDDHKRLMLEVGDNGVGLGAKGDLGSNGSNGGLSGNGGLKLGGVGLDNVKKRLELFYEHEALFEMVDLGAAGDSRGVLVKIEVPLDGSGT